MDYPYDERAPRGPLTVPLLLGAFAALCLGCPSPPSEDGGGSSTGMATSTGTTAADSTGMPGSTGGTSGGSTSAVDSDSSGSGSTGGSTGGSSGGTTAGSGSSDGGSTTEGLVPCEVGCAVEFACGTMWESELTCIEACEANLLKAESFSLFCRFAWENLSLCLGTLDCMEYEVWLDPVMIPYPCFDADQGLEIECAGQ